jgi:hypothetical protein
MEKNSYIRIFNALPYDEAVDFYIEGKLVVANLGFNEVSNYIPLSQGDYYVKVYEAGKNVIPIIEMYLPVPDNYIINAALIGIGDKMELYPIPEPVRQQKFERACVRLINLVPNSPGLKVEVQDGTELFYNVQYKDLTNYACIPGRKYNFTFKDVNNTNIAWTISNLSFLPNKYYGIFVTGKYGDNPNLQALTLLEGR